MSMTKNSDAFERYMEQLHQQEDNSFDEFISEQYFRNRCKGYLQGDPGDEQPEAQQTNDPKVVYGND